MKDHEDMETDGKCSRVDGIKMGMMKEHHRE